MRTSVSASSKRSERSTNSRPRRTFPARIASFVRVSGSTRRRICSFARPRNPIPLPDTRCQRGRESSSPSGRSTAATDTTTIRSRSGPVGGPPKCASRPEYAYFPFGGGARQCIGRRFALLELRLVLARILRSVRLEATPETELSPTPALTSRPESPVWVRVRR
ncbi:cytochrome P450 [Natrialba swarupiae]|nr:cytochrome P450 [Natrialba swarupiae]